MKQKKLLYLIAIAILLLNGCASHGVLNGSLEKYRAIYFSDVDPFAEPYEKNVSYILSHYGLETTSDTNRADALRCDLAIDQRSVWNFKFKISLWDGNRMLAAGEAVNHGNNTFLNPESAIRNLCVSALGELERELVKGGLHKK